MHSERRHEENIAGIHIDGDPRIPAFKLGQPLRKNFGEVTFTMAADQDFYGTIIICHRVDGQQTFNKAAFPVQVIEELSPLSSMLAVLVPRKPAAPAA